MPMPPILSKDMIPDKDLEITAQTGKQGAGGQNVNKVASAIRCVYKPDPSIRVFINGRDQHKNKQEAIKIVNAKVKAKRDGQQTLAYNSMRKEILGSGGRGSKIRTYNFMEHRVTDHRLGIKTHNIDDIMRGKLDIFYA